MLEDQGGCRIERGDIGGSEGNGIVLVLSLLDHLGGVC